MYQDRNWKDQPVSVLGLARSGLAAANWLAARGARVLVSDPKKAAELPVDKLHPSVELHPEGNFVREGDLVVISPGIKPSSAAWALAHAKGSEVISDIELFARLCPCPIAAVTGTDGKSTTVTLLHHLVEAWGRKAVLAGNIGFAVMDKLDELDANSVAVLEISCFQLTHTPSIKPKVSVFTNIAEDHVEYHGSMAAYIEAKKILMQNQGPGDSVVINADDQELLSWQMPAGVQRRLYGTTRPWVTAGRCWVEGNAIWLDEGPGPEKLVGAEELQIIGGHNLMNAMSAAQGALSLGVDRETLRRGLRSFSGLEHRMEFVRELDGVRWYNDSKATNPHAAGAVLEALEGGLIVIAGGSEKGSDFGDLGRLIAARTKAAVLNGGTAQRIADAIPAGHPVHLVPTLGEAILKARELARPGDLVVLAPACASFDQFKDFEHRGRVFKDLVRAL